jgi:hypothetical protein
MPYHPSNSSHILSMSRWLKNIPRLRKRCSLGTVPLHTVTFSIRRNRYGVSGLDPNRSISFA